MGGASALQKRTPQSRPDDRRYNPLGYRPSIFGGLPIVASRGNGFTVNTGNLSNGTNTSANARTMHVIAVSATDLRIVVGNHYNANSNTANEITVKIGIEYPLVSAIGGGGQVGAIMAVRFGGLSSVVVAPGGFAVSDPVPLTVLAGQIMYIHTYVSVAAAGQVWPLDLYTWSSNWEGVTQGAPAADLSLTFGIAQNTQPCYSPVAILGTPLSGHPACWALVGDSITYGSGDSVNSLGYAARACNTASIGYMQLGEPGEQAANASSIGAYEKRAIMGAGCTHALENYGRNDWGNSATLAQVQASRLAIATYFSARGVKVYAATNIPGTTSTDGWRTTANQTVTGGEAVRVALNNWIRGGAPISAGVAVAVGTSGALLMGQVGHPYSGYFELADPVESSRDSGKFKVPVRSITDGAVNGAAFTSPSQAQFTTADVGREVSLPGAGVAGALFMTTIAAYTSSTAVTLTSAASTVVSGASCGIGVYTVDGTHPSQDGHLAMAAAMSSMGSL